MYQYIEDPKEIERKSFEIIHNEMLNTNLPALRLSIMQRVIHTTTDFIYEDILLFKGNTEEAILSAFLEGATLITDTQMIRSGISKPLANKLGIAIECFVSSEEAHQIAKEKGITRSMAAVDIAMNIKGKKIFAIGNAPTAVYRIMEWVDQGAEDVVAVIGVPVGFVGASESKDSLFDSKIPSIITKGRKGGSTIAVAIINAILRAAVNPLGA